MNGSANGPGSPVHLPGSARLSIDGGKAAVGEHGCRDGAAPLPPTPARCLLSEQLVALSSRVLLSQAEPKGEDIIPMGAIVTPALLPTSRGTEGEEATPRPSLPGTLGEPPACTSCGAWQNCYAPTNAATGEWHCNFCLHLNSGSSSSHGGVGAAASRSAAALGEAVDWVGPSAAPTSGAGTGTGLLALVVDVCIEQPQLDVVKESVLQALHGLHSGTQVALVTFAARSVAAYRMAPSPQRLSPRGPPNSEAQPAVVECDVLPGDAYLPDEVLAALQRGVHSSPLLNCRQQLVAAITSLRTHAPVGAGARSLGAALEAALHIAVVLDGPGDLPASTAEGAAAAHPEQQRMEKGPPPQGTTPGAGDASPRAPSRAHVVVVTAGAASAYAIGVEEGGPRGNEGAEEESEERAAARAAYFDEVARVAADHGVTLDIVAAAEHGRQLAPLAQATGGLFALHAPVAPAPSSPAPEGAAKGSAVGSAGVAATDAEGAGGSRVDGTSSADGVDAAAGSGGGESSSSGQSFGASVAAAVVRPAGLGCLLEVRTSHGLVVVEAYGAVLPLCINGSLVDDWQTLTGRRDQPPPHWSNPRFSIYRTGVPDSGTGGVTLMLQGDKAPRQQHVFLQVCFRWTDADGSSMSRIITRRLTTTQNPAAAVEAIDPLVTGLVWAKMVAAQALERGAAADRKQAEILRRRLGQQLADFAAARLLPDESSRGWLSGPSRFLLPDAFLPLAAVLHQLSRGPLLSHAAMPSADARELLQAHFMTASLQRSRLTLLPQMHLLLPSGNGPVTPSSSAAFLPPAPAADVLLLPGAAGVVDAGSKLFVWLGEGSSTQQREACTQLAQTLAVGRLPAPDVAVVAAGGVEETERLWPRLLLLADAPRHVQLCLVPLLERLPMARVAAAAAAARAWRDESGERSLMDWTRQLGIVPMG